MPLHFTTIGAIHGSLSLSAALGYDLSNVSNNAALPALFGSTSPSFDIGPLDRQEFARGLIHPIDPGLFRLLSSRSFLKLIGRTRIAAEDDAHRLLSLPRYGPGNAAPPVPRDSTPVSS